MRKRLPRDSYEYVKTTVDLPRTLLKQAKHHAVTKDITLKKLIINALRRELKLG